MKTIIKLGFGLTITAFGASEILAEQVKWSVSLWGKRRGFTENVEKLSEVVARKTNGDFQIKLHYGGVLSKSRENLDGISIGAFEMAQFCVIYHPEKTPALTVGSLPFLPANDLNEQIKINQAIYHHPAVKKDARRWNAMLLMPTPLPQYNLVGRGKVPMTVKDLKGMRIRLGGGAGKLIKELGAIPTMFTASETYTALDTGALDAAGFAPHAHLAFKMVELGEYYTTNLNPGTVDCPVVVNQQAFDDLSKKHQNVLLGSVDEALDHYVKNYGKSYTQFDAEVKKRNMKKITYSNADLKLIRSKASIIWDNWIEEKEAQGIPARDLLDTALNAVK